MADPIPPMPDPTPDPKTKSKGPEFTFVENRRSSLFTLRWHDKDAPAPGAANAKYLGSGLNYVAVSTVKACTLKGEEFGAQTGGAIAEVNPLIMRTQEIVELVGRTSSRQACYELRKIDKRPEVQAAIDKRLERKATDAVAEQ